jgi:hypothetical protein
MSEKREMPCETKLEALRSDIAEGLASGPVKPLDMRAAKADTRQRRRQAWRVKYSCNS